MGRAGSRKRGGDISRRTRLSTRIGRINGWDGVKEPGQKVKSGDSVDEYIHVRSE
jgi:hypothetical protein